MHILKRIVLSIVLITTTVQQNRGSDPAPPRLIYVADGWAKNSVNAGAYRHNNLVTEGNTQYIAFYNAGQFLVLGKRKLGTDKWELHTTPYKGNTMDAHNYIAIMTDGKGYLHVSWDHHNNELRYARSVAPGSLQLTDKMPMTGIKEKSVSYPEFYRLPNGNLLCLYRDGSSGNGDLMMNRYDVNTQKWTQVQNGWINGEGQRNAYWQMATDKKGAIHLAWVWRETGDVATNHDIAYARSRDGGKTWEKSTGEKYKLPITMNSAEYACRIPQKSELINPPTITADEAGHPYIATYWRDSNSAVPQYRLVYKQNGRWAQQQITHRVTPFTLAGGGTKRIPIARPQLVIKSNNGTPQGILIFRDEERDTKISVAVSNDLDKGNWQIKDLSTESVSMWEPNYDTELWKQKGWLHLFIQKVEQGDAETLKDMPPQPISVLEWTPDWSPDNSFAQLKKAFAQPGKDYGSAPLWVWHTKITKTIIDSMMQEFKQNAFGGVMVHPRPGLITEYLSKEWLDLYKYTVEKGKQLGLNVWIYDENSYPSGFAGGLLPHQMPESYNQGQMLRMTKTTICPDDTTGMFIILKEVNGSFTDITTSISQEKGKSGNYYCFSKVYYQKQAGMVGPPDYPYVDLMVKGVTEKFIDITCKAYENVVGNEFGKTIPGIFSDEPSIPAHGAGQIRWTPDLFSTFQQLWGYDLRTNLPSLFEETGDWKKVRHNFQQTLLHLFIDRWSKPMYNYTQQHHLKWTGHYWEHGWPDPGEGPDNMAMYAWHQQPGIDMLFNQFNETSPNAQFGNIRSVKELASVANQLDKERTLSETYGGGGWELTFKDMKRLADWEYVLGVNFLNQHLSMITLTGVRKYDYPQSFSYHAPWWPYYKTLNSYYARLSYALSQGEQVNDILVIEPTTSAWMYSLNGRPNKRMRDIGEAFQSFITRLEKSQVEYDLGCENIIKDHGKAENAKFIVGSRKYSTVVIPPGMENIDAHTFKLLKAFVEQGGKLLQFEQLQRVDGAVSNELSVLNKKTLSPDQPFADPVIKVEGGNLYHHRRVLPDGQLLFLANSSMESTATGSVEVAGKDVLLMNLFTGETLDYPEQGNTVSFTVPPAGSLLLFIANNEQSGYKKYTAPANTTTVATSKTQVMRPKENVLMIDFCDVQFKDTLLKDCHTFTASRVAFQKHGFNKDPWDHQMQFQKRIIARDTFSKGTGFTATYRFTIDATVNYKQCRAVVEQGALWKKITINGKPVQPAQNKWWLDRSFAVLEIGNYLQAGENALSISIDPMSIYAEIEPVYILGNFNVTPATKGWTITAPQPLQPGSWKQQGLPLYAHGITYVKECNLANTTGNYAVTLGDWKGTVASVAVNGVPAGIIIAEPNTLDITPFLKKGNNRIAVTITGSLKNLLGPHHNNPKPGMVGPGHWSNVKSYPSGSEYQLYDYGLMEDFSVVKY